LITIGAEVGAAYREEERAGSGNVLIGYGTGEAVGSGRRRKPRGAVAVAPAAAGVVRVISPLVRRLARDAEVDLKSVVGTGADGLIVRRDVELAIASRVGDAAGEVVGGSAAAAEKVVSESPVPVGAGGTVAGARMAEVGGGLLPAAGAAGAAADGATGGVLDGRTSLPELRREGMSGFRKVVAATLSRSRREIPEATTWVDVDATALLELRESLRSATDAGPGLLALMARFVVAGLVKYPELNGFVDTERDELVQYDGVNLGLAAQTERGLVVPAVANAHKLSARGLDGEIKKLMETARTGRLTPEELNRGTFTLNNYGSFGVDGSAAIINHPQVAILGVGRIIDRPWVVDGELAVRKLTQLSLVFDHRVCDGGTAAGFLRFVADAFENPTSAFADL
jgi:pyruvate dehydrogenase E2 component (dihydrolipoamide acetyltransferase)